MCNKISLYMVMLAVLLLTLPVQAQKKLTYQAISAPVENVPARLFHGITAADAASVMGRSAHHTPRRVASVDELVGNCMLVSSYYERTNGLQPATPSQGATPISIAKVDDNTIAISGFVSGATNTVLATVDVAAGTLTIEVGQTLFESDYGPVLLANADGNNPFSGPLNGTIGSDGNIYINALWYEIIGGDGQYANYMYSGRIYFSYVAPVSGTMTWVDNNNTDRSVDIYVEQTDSKTATVYNFGGFETAINVSMKADSTFVIDNQPVFSNSNGVFVVTGFNETGDDLGSLVGTGTESVLTFDRCWTILSPTTGYSIYMQQPATISLTGNQTFAYPVIPDVAAMPASPKVVKVDGYNDATGYGAVLADVPVVDANGNDLLDSKLYYQFYSDVDGDIQPVVLPAALYKNLTADLSLIPYRLNDNFDFQAYQGQKVVYLNFPFDYDRIGVKSVYKGGNTTTETDINWYALRIKNLPYKNTLATAAQFSDFTVIDANADNCSWAFNADNNAAAYSYSSSNNGDDWLVSRPILLEAGKSYRVALDARNRNYDERFEVMMGATPTAAGMTTEVIPATVVKSTENVTFENQMVTVAETGYYYIGIHAISDANMFQLFVNNFVVEAGLDPASPDSVTDFAVLPVEGKLETVVRFKAPALTAGGSPLTSLTKIDILRDDAVVTSLTEVAPGVEYTYTDCTDDLTLGYHTYQVIAANEAGIGVKSEKKSVFLSLVYEVPVSFDLTKKDVFNTFQVIDANADMKTWTWDNENGTYYNYGYNAADDYLISAPVKLEAGKKYVGVVKASSASESYPEAFRLVVGKEASVYGLNTVVIDTTQMATTVLTDYENEFSVAETGSYYVAIHAVSPGNMWRLNVSRLSIEKAPEPTAPAAVSDLVVTAGSKGALEATISFTAPAKAINGTNLIENMSVNVLRDDSLVTTLENVVPGTLYTWTEQNLEQGMTYTYQVVAANASGAGLKSAKASVFIGVDLPAGVTNLFATDAGTSVDFTWPAVGEEGANGGYVNPANVDYELWSFKIVNTPYGSSLAYDEKLMSVTGQNSCSIAMNTDEGEQDFKIWGIMPVNAAGKGGYAVTSMLVGAPYMLPFTETFAEGSFHYVWDYTDNAGLYVAQESSDEDGISLAVTAMNEAGTASIYTGKLSLANAVNPTLIFDVKSATLNKLNVIGSTVGGAFTVIQSEVPVTTNFTTVQVSLNALKDARYVQVGFSAAFATPTKKEYSYETYQYETTFGDMLTIDNVRIVDLQDTGVNTAKNNEVGQSIYTVDGKLVNRQAANMKGIYIVNSKKVLTK